MKTKEELVKHYKEQVEKVKGANKRQDYIDFAQGELDAVIDNGMEGLLKYWEIFNKTDTVWFKNHHYVFEQLSKYLKLSFCVDKMEGYSIQYSTYAPEKKQIELKFNSIADSRYIKGLVELNTTSDNEVVIEDQFITIR